jgi:hypothetical protein
VLTNDEELTALQAKAKRTRPVDGRQPQMLMRVGGGKAKNPRGGKQTNPGYRFRKPRKKAG